MRALVFVLLIVPGCLAPAADEDTSPLERVGQLAFDPPVSTGLPALFPVSLSQFEPYIVVDESDRIFVAEGYGRMARSDDQGATFVPLVAPWSDPVFSRGDVALAVGGGRLWIAKTLEAEGQENGGLKLASSTDGGLTWTEHARVDEGSPDRPWIAWGTEGLVASWLDVDTFNLQVARGVLPSPLGDIHMLGADAGAGNLVATPRGFVLANCFEIHRGLDDVARWPRGEHSCESRPMLAFEPNSGRLDAAFFDGAGHLCVLRSMDEGATWRTVHCEPAERLAAKEKVPEAWIVADAQQTVVGWFEREGPDRLVFHVMRITEGQYARGKVDAGQIVMEEAPAATDFPALALLHDGRIVLSWAPSRGDTFVAVESTR